MSDWKNKIKLDKLNDEVLRQVTNSNVEKLVALQLGDLSTNEKQEEFDKLQALVDAFSAEQTRRAEVKKAEEATEDRKPLELSTNATRNIKIKNIHKK